MISKRFLQEVRVGLMFLTLVLSTSLQAKIATDYHPKTRPPREGNFILPASQQLTPLVSFGQDIIGAGKTQLYVYGDVFKGRDGYKEDLVIPLIHGFTDRFSGTVSFPALTSYKHGRKRYSGMEDMFLQFEGAIFEDPTPLHEEQGTIVVNVTLPTGIADTEPAMLGPFYRFLVGGTFERLYTDWYLFASPGVVFTTIHNGFKFGEQFLYQWGVGREIYTINKDWLFAGLVEFNGQYTRKAKMYGVDDPDSGGNIIQITPSLWISSQRLILQLGMGFYPLQNLNGAQGKDKYIILADIALTF